MRHGTKCSIVGRAGTSGIHGADAIDLSSPSVPKHYRALFFVQCAQRLRLDDLCVRAHPLGEGQEETIVHMIAQEPLTGDNRQTFCKLIAKGFLCKHRSYLGTLLLFPPLSSQVLLSVHVSIVSSA